MMDVASYLKRWPTPRWVMERAAAHPDRARFFVPAAEGWQPVTWSEHAAAIEDIAAFVGSRFAPGTRGAIFSENSVEWAAAALGIEAAGMIMVPIYPASTADQAAYVVGHSGARVLFVAGAELLTRVFDRIDAYADVDAIVVLGSESPPADDPKLMSWSSARAIGSAILAEDDALVQRSVRELDLDAPAIMLYTSGTTGNPKGVPLTHENLGSNTRDWLRCNAALLHEDATDLLWLPMSHIFGFGELGLGHILGFTTYLATPQTVIERMAEVKPTVFMSVPAYWEKLAAPALQAANSEAARRAFDEITGGKLRYCLSGGAGLKAEVKEVFERCGTLIIEGYGLTETSPTLTMNRPDDYRFDAVGKPLPTVEIKLAEDGEILAKGPNVFSGYHEDPEATRAAFTSDGWFRTGDVGRFTDDGFLQIIDRKKEILVTAGGKNVPPANIERQFATEPAVAHAVVYGDGKKYLVAGIWPADDLDAAQAQQLAEEAVARANAPLARFEQIKRFRLMHRPLTVEGGLLTSTLKLRRKRVYDEFRTEFEELYES